ncbi:hypothetical protein IMZ48_04000 [Candidatus Bathyarchaeota archaeon]|nr:hypothetical protein [Candidatus Bathyarchaeota archaeon]
MRLLSLAPLVALAAAANHGSLCPPTASTRTLWRKDGAAYACAKLPSDGLLSLGSGTHCITAPLAEVSGKKDTCRVSSDCDGGLCVDTGRRDTRRVCWGLATGGECREYSEREEK